MKHNKKTLTALGTILISVVVCITASISHYSNQSEQKTVYQHTDSELTAHFIDVGQGDSEFIELPNGKCMLIDAGTDEYSDKVIDMIEGYGYSKIDYLVATHPHADHIGAMDEVIDNFEIGTVYMPKVSSTTKAFESLLTAISDNGLKINTAKAGVTIFDDDDLRIELLAPVSQSYDELNNYSAVVKITYGLNSFLFMGDAEELVEHEIDASSLDADVLKVGHHGSRYSSSKEFLESVTPYNAIISCGEDNPYNHPHSQTIKRLEDCQVDILRTDKLGTISFSCNGDGNYDVKTEKPRVYN